MKKLTHLAVTLATLTMTGLALAGTASAIPLAGEPADQAVRVLESEGYTVRINQSVTVPLATCKVLGISGLRGTDDNGVLRDPGSLNVATIDVNCPPPS